MGDKLYEEVYRKPTPKIEKTKYSRLFDYFLSVDLGKKVDYTALSVIEQDLNTGKYVIKGLSRFNQLPEPQIISKIKDAIGRLPSKSICLTVDATGAGDLFCDQLYLGIAPLDMIRLTITGGSKVSNEGGLHVPKELLVYCGEAVIDNERLIIPDTLPLLKTFLKEFATFSRKPTPAGNMTYESLRSSVHDDIVISILMGLYVCDKLYPMLEMDKQATTSAARYGADSFSGLPVADFLRQEDIDEMLSPGGYAPEGPSLERVRKLVFA